MSRCQLKNRETLRAQVERGDLPSQRPRPTQAAVRSDHYQTNKEWETSSKKLKSDKESLRSPLDNPAGFVREIQVDQAEELQQLVEGRDFEVEEVGEQAVDLVARQPVEPVVARQPVIITHNVAKGRRVTFHAMATCAFSYRVEKKTCLVVDGIPACPLIDFSLVAKLTSIRMEQGSRSRHPCPGVFKISVAPLPKDRNEAVAKITAAIVANMKANRPNCHAAMDAWALIPVYIGKKRCFVQALLCASLQRAVRNEIFNVVICFALTMSSS